MINSIIKPMLLESSNAVSTKDNFIHEIKLDGFRCILKLANGRILLQSRHGNFTKSFPEIEAALNFINAREVILDGEMVCMKEGQPDFELVMRRYMTNRTEKIRPLTLSCPATYYAFDILYKDGKNLTSMPLIQRKDILTDTVSENNYIRIVDYYINKGPELFEICKKLDLEGIVEKRLTSLYSLNTRSKDWLKIMNYRFTECFITGLRKSKFGLYLADEKQKPLGVCEFVPPAGRQTIYNVLPLIKEGENEEKIYFKPILKCVAKHVGYTSKGYLRTPALVRLQV